MDTLLQFVTTAHESTVISKISIKIILSTQIIQKQSAGQIWTTGHSVLIPGLG